MFIAIIAGLITFSFATVLMIAGVGAAFILIHVFLVSEKTKMLAAII